MNGGFPALCESLDVGKMRDGRIREATAAAFGWIFVSFSPIAEPEAVTASAVFRFLSLESAWLGLYDDLRH
jgi:hypothetical protein